jgi:hypothetical protein
MSRVAAFTLSDVLKIPPTVRVAPQAIASESGGHAGSTNCADTEYGSSTHRRSGRSAAGCQPSGQLPSPRPPKAKSRLKLPVNGGLPSAWHGIARPTRRSSHGEANDNCALENLLLLLLLLNIRDVPGGADHQTSQRKILELEAAD